METNRFDALARILGAGATRRGIAHLLTGGALVGVFRDVDAKKRRKKRHKKRRKKKHDGGGERCTDADCGTGQLCAGGQCVTGQGTCAQEASSICVDTCNGSHQCVCYQTYEGWFEETLEVRCGDNSIQSNCGECGTDADCSSYGPGSFCAIELTGNCGGCADAQGFCRTPCPS